MICKKCPLSYQKKENKAIKLFCGVTDKEVQWEEGCTRTNTWIEKQSEDVIKSGWGMEVLGKDWKPRNQSRRRKW